MKFAWLKRILEPSPQHLRTGVWGERCAEKHIKHAGMKVIGRRTKVHRDEFDLIAHDGETLVFLEVKTRKNEQYGRPYSAVDRRKQKILSRAAVRYLKRCRRKPKYVRFDVIEVIGEQALGTPEIRHIKNAFPLSKKYSLIW